MLICLDDVTTHKTKMIAFKKKFPKISTFGFFPLFFLAHSVTLSRGKMVLLYHRIPCKLPIPAALLMERIAQIMQISLLLKGQS